MIQQIFDSINVALADTKDREIVIIAFAKIPSFWMWAFGGEEVDICKFIALHYEAI